MVFSDHPAEKSLPDRRRTQGTLHTDRKDVSAGTVDDPLHAGFHIVVGKRQQIRFHVFERRRHVFAERCRWKALQHFLEQRSRALEQRPGHRAE